MIKENSLKAWLLASRPKTLTGAVAPVIVAIAIAYSDLSSINAYHEAHLIPQLTMRWVPALLCLLFAIVMQIDANLINDYVDWKRGVDRKDRLGPKRACAEGWVTPYAMKHAIMLTTLLAVCIGLPLVYYGGMMMLAIGALCILFCFLYSTLLAGRGLGDLLVVLFFGIVPVCTTYYLLTHGMVFASHTFSGLTYNVFYIALAQGLVTDCLLMVNNYRDRHTDRACGKRTLVVMIGDTASEVLYLMLGLVAVILCFPMMKVHPYTAYLPALYILPHFMTWNRMTTIREGKELNSILARTSINILLFSILLAIGVNL